VIDLATITVNDKIFLSQYDMDVVIEYDVLQDVFRDIQGDWGMGNTFFQPSLSGFVLVTGSHVSEYNTDESSIVWTKEIELSGDYSCPKSWIVYDDCYYWTTDRDVNTLNENFKSKGIKSII